MKKTCVFAVLVILLLLVSCGPKTKPQCSEDGDCRSKACKTVSCENAKCVYDPIPECCGNDICEEDAGENECTCGDDCGKCEGKAQLPTARAGRFKDAQYVENFCTPQDECVFGVDPSRIKETQLVDERETNFFKIEVLTTFNQPFSVQFDKFKFEIELKDAGEDLVPPIKITNMQLKSGSLFFGEIDIDKVLEKVGDKINVEVPMTYDPDAIEEERTLSYKMSYEYVRRVEISDGFRDDLVRDDHEKKFSYDIFLVDTGE
jgi:hypothetical protein